MVCALVALIGGIAVGWLLCDRGRSKWPKVIVSPVPGVYINEARAAEIKAKWRAACLSNKYGEAIVFSEPCNIEVVYADHAEHLEPEVSQVDDEYGLCCGEGVWMKESNGHTFKGTRGDMAASLQSLRSEDVTDVYEVRPLPTE